MILDDPRAPHPQLPADLNVVRRQLEKIMKYLRENVWNKKEEEKK